MTGFGPVAHQLREVGIEVHTLGMRRGVPNLGAFWRLVKLLRRSKPDLLLCWMYHANLLGLLAGKLAGVPQVWWGIRASNMDFTLYRPLTRLVVWLGGRLSWLPELIIVNSEAGRKLHAGRGYSTSKMVVIPNGVDLQEFKADPSAREMVRNELGLGEDVLLVGLIARFDPMKGHKTFFEVAGLLVRRFQKVHFLLAGRGLSPENLEVSRMVHANSLEGVVHLMGIRQDIPRLTAALDIATSCSPFGEGFSNAIIEAMACGVPCVVTDVGDAVLIVGDTGMVVPPRNPKALAEALVEMVEMNPQERQALGAKARERIQVNFPLASMVRAFESLYERVHDGREFKAMNGVQV